MKDLRYFKPKTWQEALALKAEHGAKMRVLAGGTDLMVQLRQGAKQLDGVTMLLDLSAVEGMSGIEVGEKTVRIGALTTHSQMNHSPELRKHAEFLSVAASTVGSEQIRNVGTVGGNICNASPAADTPSALMALDARLIVKSLRGERVLPLGEAYVKSGVLALEDDEVVSAVEFDRIDGYTTAFIKVGRRKALAISRMNMAVALRVVDGIIEDSRIVPGCVFSTPARVEKAEGFLKGKAPSLELFEACGDIVSEVMIEKTGIRWSTEYKKPVVEALTAQALCRAAGIDEE
ncbi:MAG: FAD binding domain-containing protein [Oscillospiraceae bacterium]|nr:FAD binding domain-containing protein [Oscillospiraceae bacterium]